MPDALFVSLRTATLGAVFFVNNETIRGLLTILSELGQDISPVLASKSELTDALLRHLETETLKVLQLNLYNANKDRLGNGVGTWNFYVNYSSGGRGIVEVPVRTILQHIDDSGQDSSAIASYGLTFWLRSGGRLPEDDDLNRHTSIYTVRELEPDWGTGVRSAEQSPSTFVGAYGWESLKVSIRRE